MKWNCFAGTAIIPTIARIVLGMAFITAGLHKVARHVEFTAEQAATLKTEFNVNLEPVKTATTVALLSTFALPQDQNEEAKAPPIEDEPVAPSGNPDMPPVDVKPVPQPSAADPPAEVPAAGDTEDDADDRPKPPAANDPPVIIEIPVEQPAESLPPVDAGQKYRGLALLQIALLLHDEGISNGYTLAWIAALTEFVGGVLILVGLFSRVWGVGLAIAMGMAFFLTSVEPYFSAVGPFEAAAGADGHALYNRVFAQLGLGVLALTIFLAGPGPISLDRLIFRPKRAELEVVEKN